MAASLKAQYNFPYTDCFAAALAPPRHSKKSELLLGGVDYKFDFKSVVLNG